MALPGWRPSPVDRLGAGWREPVAALCLAAAVGLAVAPLADLELTPPGADEFVVGHDARRLLDGEVPYRDFHAIEPPGAIALHAALYTVVGRSHLASRVLGGFIAGAIAAIAWVLLGRGAPPGDRGPRPALLRLLAALGGGLAPFLLWPYPTAHAPATLCILAALLVVSAAAPRPGHFLGAGMLAGAAGLFHPAFGLPAVVGLGTRVGRWWRDMPWVVVGGAAAVALAAVPLAVAGALPVAVTSLLWPFTHYRTPGGGNEVMFGEGIATGIGRAQAAAGTLGAAGFVVLALAVLVVSIVGPALLAPSALLAGRARQRTDDAASSMEMVAPLWAGALTLTLVQLYQRADLAHLGFAAALSLPAAAALGPPSRRAFVVIGRFLSLAAGSAALLLLGARLHATGAHVPRFDAVAREWPEVKLLRALTGPDDRIAVLPAGGFYYSFARRDATGYSWLLAPAVRYHGDADYAQVAAAIARNQAHLVWFTSEQSERDFLEHAGLLSQALARDYHPETAAPGMRVYVRNGSPRPDGPSNF